MLCAQVCERFPRYGMDDVCDIDFIHFLSLLKYIDYHPAPYVVMVEMQGTGNSPWKAQDWPTDTPAPPDRPQSVEEMALYLNSIVKR